MILTFFQIKKEKVTAAGFFLVGYPDADSNIIPVGIVYASIKCNSIRCCICSH
jgi:hypothetical protein